MHLWRTACLLLVVCGSLVAEEVRAESASGPDASPCTGEISAIPASGTVPANLPRIVVDRPRWLSLVASDGHFVRLDASPTTTGTVFLLSEALVVGERYELRDSCPSSPPVLARYYVAPPVPLPTELGTLRIVSHRAFYVVPPWRDRRTFLEVELVPHESVLPWLDAYDAQLTSDSPRGSIYTEWRSLRDGLTWQVEIPCPRDETHALSLRASAGHVSTHPGPRIEATLMDTLRCEDAVVFDYATGRELTPEEVAEIERVASVTDGAFPDAAYVSIDGGSATMPTEPDTNGNCSASPSRARSPCWFALSVLGLALLRRAKRR